MAPAPTDATSGDDALQDAVRARLDSIDSGNYRRDNELVLNVFGDFLREERGVTRLADVEVIDCRRYAQWLRRQATTDADDGPDVSPASASERGPYFTLVRAFLEWCVDDERLDRNPARPNRVTEPLPEDRGSPDRQFWRVEDRRTILSFVDERAEAGGDADRRRALRDRALVATLALTGVRGAEVFRDPRDDERDGLRWRDLDLDRGVARVLGKVREYELVTLPEGATSRLSDYRDALEPPTSEWPVFPTGHAPTLARRARAALSERGLGEGEIEAELADAVARSVLRRHEIPPPSISKSGARDLMRRLCTDAGVDVDGEYLKPHGGRRGLGHQLYAEGSAELAQAALRHASVETTHDAYREERVAERRERIEGVLDE